MSTATLSVKTSEMAMNGRKLIQGIIQANVERQGILGPVWPHAKVDGRKRGDDIASQVFGSATDYFNVLFDMDHYGTSEWEPYVEGDALSAFGKDTVMHKKISRTGLDWCIAANVTDEMPDVIPVLVSANLNPALLLRRWNGEKDGSVQLPIGPSSGATKSMFGDKAVVILRKSGAVEVIKEKLLTYDNLYNKLGFDLSNMNPPLVYLTPDGVVDPVGHK